MFQRAGMLVALSSPSGGGKSVILEALFKRLDGLRYSVSVTSRAPRDGEIEGHDYIFVSRDAFEAKIEAGEFLESAEVHGNLYGTPRAAVEETLGQGFDIALDVDVQGGVQIKNKMPEAVLIFIMPPSVQELEARLRRRAIDSEDAIQQRLRNAPREIERWHEYDYVVVNENLEQAIQDVETIIRSERARVFRLRLAPRGDSV